MLQLASFLLLGHDDFSQKIVQDRLFLAPVLTNKILGRKIACAKYQTETIENGGVPHKALGILPALFHRWSTTSLLQKKISVPQHMLYSSTVLYFSVLVL